MTVDATEDEEMTALVDADIPRVDLVGLGANGVPRFLIAKSSTGLMSADDVRELLAKADMSTASIDDLPDSAFAYIEPGGKKDENGRTTPRSLRHFPIHDAAHVRNALSRAPQSPFGDDAMPTIRAAAKKYGIEVSKMADDVEPTDMTALDVTEPLGVPTETAPGLDTTPGSPAWEAVDAATARKWTSILARAKAAVCVMAERELLEAAAGHGEDALSAMDLDEARAAIDHAIRILAPFAVDEQAEADTAAAQMVAVGKALAGLDADVLGEIEAYGEISKAGRVLSTANEKAIRGAVESLTKVLASLPAAPAIDEEQAVTKAFMEERAMSQQDETKTDGESVVKTEPSSEPETAEVAKADDAETEAPKVTPVYDMRGRLIGVVSPGAITAVEQPGDEPTETSDADTETVVVDEPAVDLTPAPANEVGIPADATEEDNKLTKAAGATELFKSIADDVAKQLIDAYSASQQEIVAKQAADLKAMADTIDVLKAQVEALEEQPAAPKVFSNGAVPPAHMLRGQDSGAPLGIDVAKAAEMKRGLYASAGANAPGQDAIAGKMNAAAIDALHRIHAGQPV